MAGDSAAAGLLHFLIKLAMCPLTETNLKS
jgi:hypothetical protein